MRFLKGLLAVLLALPLVKGGANGSSSSAPYSSLHLLTTELGVQQLPQAEWRRLQSRLQVLIGMAFERATLLRLGTNNSNLLQGPSSPSPFTVQILSAEERLEGGTQLDFVVLLQGSPVLAQVVAEDLSLLTLSHISALLQYPVLYIGSKYQKQVVEGSRWWIIAIIIGSGFIVGLCGWALLFLYYNTCGRPLGLIQHKKFSREITGNFEGKAGVNDYKTTVIPLPQPPTIVNRGEEELEEQSKRLQYSPLPSLTPSISPQMQWEKETLDQPSPIPPVPCSQGQQTRLDGLPIEHAPTAVVHFVEKEEEQQRQQKRIAGSSGREVPKQLSKEEVLLPTQTWSPYLAGDQVAAILAVSPQFLTPDVGDYPMPITTETGVLQLHAKKICPVAKY